MYEEEESLVVVGITPSLPLPTPSSSQFERQREIEEIGRQMR